MRRRGLLLGMAALFMAPAIVRASSLMKISVIDMPWVMPEDAFITIGGKNYVWSESMWVPVANKIVKHWSDFVPPARIEPYDTGIRAQVDDGKIDYAIARHEDEPDWRGENAID